jgi:hypothetical protein
MLFHLHCSCSALQLEVSTPARELDDDAKSIKSRDLASLAIYGARAELGRPALRHAGISLVGGCRVLAEDGTVWSLLEGQRLNLVGRRLSGMGSLSE